ncbi:hypothetical protein ACRAWG_20445 [Methylobacterium sp. P31]
MRLAALAVGGQHDADRLRERLRLSKQEHGQLIGYAQALATLHGRAEIDGTAARALAAEHGVTLLKETVLILSGEPRPVVTEDARRALQDLDGEGGAPIFPLAGADLVAAGVPPGPAIGRGLAAARKIWLALGCPAGPDVRAELMARALEGTRES